MGDKNKNLLQLQQKTPSGSGGFGHQRVSLDEDLGLSIATSLSLITASYGLGVVLCQFPNVYDLEVFRSENGSHRIVPYSFSHQKLENQLSTSFLRGLGDLNLNVHSIKLRYCICWKLMVGSFPFKMVPKLRGRIRSFVFFCWMFFVGGSKAEISVYKQASEWGSQINNCLQDGVQLLPMSLSSVSWKRNSQRKISHFYMCEKYPPKPSQA